LLKLPLKGEGGGIQEDSLPSIISLMTSWLFFDNFSSMGMVLLSLVCGAKNLEDYTLF